MAAKTRKQEVNVLNISKNNVSGGIQAYVTAVCTEQQIKHFLVAGHAWLSDCGVAACML